jgi:hypothetical protein
VKAVFLFAFSKPRSAWRCFAHAVLFAVCIVGMCFAHELSHAAAALGFGGRVLAINVLGAMWYPRFELTPEFGYGGYVAWQIPPSSLLTHLIVAAGSTGTLLIALSAALLLRGFHPRGTARTALTALSFYFADSIIHIIPVWGQTSNAAPPWVRSFAEAHYALLDLGVRSEVYLAFVLTSTLLILILFVRSLPFARNLP